MLDIHKLAREALDKRYAEQVKIKAEAEMELYHLRKQFGELDAVCGHRAMQDEGCVTIKETY